MKSAVTEVMDIIEMEHNNGVEISQKVLWKMLLEAKEKEKQQIIDVYNDAITNEIGIKSPPTNGRKYYEKTFEQ